MPKIYEFLDLSKKRFVYAVGDIHGRFNALDELLAKARFDKEQDFLISVGDLVDRGDSNYRCVEYIGRPWFKHIIGNHEEMALGHIQGDSYIHTINGGGWLSKLPIEEQEYTVKQLMNSCYLLEVLTKNGYRCGFVHADLIWGTWQENIEAPDIKTFTWSREGVRQLRQPFYDPTVKGIDKVFFGHNAMYNPVHRGNCYWIDTGSGFADGHLTLINIETDTYTKETI